MLNKPKSDLRSHAMDFPWDYKYTIVLWSSQQLKSIYRSNFIFEYNNTNRKHNYCGIGTPGDRITAE